MQRYTYRIDLAYDGSCFFGFSRQPGRATVESTLVTALQALVPELAGVAVAARTDRGVHALGQVVSFWSRRALPLARIQSAVDAAARHALVVRHVAEVPRSFHASFSAKERSYVYLHQHDGEVDAERLDRMLQLLIGRRSFSAFARDTPAGRPTVRRLSMARARQVGAGRVRFDFTADGFLRHQVRVMVATALRELRCGATEGALLELCEAGDRRATAAAAPPSGLYLVGVRYDDL